MIKLGTERGDTLIEVLISLAVLSLVIVGGNVLMNFGMRNAITAMEHTQVRNLIVGQAELLRYLRDNAEKNEDNSLSQAWYDRLLNNNTYVRPTGASDLETCEPSNSRDFYLTAEFQGASQLPVITVKDYKGNAPSDGRPYAVPGNGLWIEAVESPASAQQPYVDFHIRACWKGAGTSVDQQSNTVVRLYTP